MKKITALFLALSMALSLIACSAPSQPAEAEKAASGKVGMSISTMANPFFVTLTEGAKAEAADLGLELITADAADDAAQQEADIRDMISKSVDVLIVNPVDSDKVAAVVEEAINAGIKVIAVDRLVNGVKVDCTIASDNLDGAAMATEYIINTLGRDVQVAELVGTPNASATIERGTGFNNTAENTLDVVASEVANFNRADGKAAMEKILAANPDVKAVFAHNDEMALGALEAINGQDIMVVGFDATDDAIAAIKDGKMAATVAQRPELMGQTAIETANKLIIGKNILNTIAVDVHLVNQENVNN